MDAPKCGTLEGNSAPDRMLLYIEQKSDAGEDAEPTGLAAGPAAGLLAVYDGMGGAGGAAIRTPEGDVRTGAYYAARLAKKVLEERFMEATALADNPRGSFADGAAFAAELSQCLAETFTSRADEIEREPSKLRSSLIRRLPTTMAAIAYEASLTLPEDTKSGLAAGSCRLHALWAGDSRGYLLDPQNGLQQVTRDDVKSHGDAFENLVEDSPLSNCISADQPFKIHCSTREASPPLILLVATDGCFGFLSTPAHFESLLLSSLVSAASMDDWRLRLTEQLRSVTGDDATLALRALGWPNFTALKTAFSKRCALVYKSYVKEIDELEAKIRELDGAAGGSSEQRDALRADRRRLRTAAWSAYKTAYERFESAASPPL